MSTLEHPQPTPAALASVPEAEPQELSDEDAGALLALRDANPGSELPEVWRGAPSAGWPGLVTDPHDNAVLEIVLDGRALAVVPPDIGSLGRLTKLWLSNNGLRALPPEVERLQHLDSLWLGGNLLRSGTLPSAMTRLTALKKL
ncbi:peptidyl-prolyl cis-trans isomerase, FKBP-type, partial [Monoraphidium neglectum]